MALSHLNILVTSESPKWFGFSHPPLAQQPRLVRSPKFSMTSTVPDLSSKKTRKSLGHPNPKESAGSTPSLWMPAEKAEIFNSMENWARENVVPLLKPVKESWQPQDLLPDPMADGFYDQMKEIRERAKEIPDDYFVVLVGDMITEEALPSYHARLNGNPLFHDQTGVDDTPWAIWARGWSAEENRHGDLLNKYLYLSGRVDIKQIEDLGVGNNPYYVNIYTSFQERATFISHRNTAKLANNYGDSKLAQICGVIASDERRHEAAYTKISAKLFELDPNGMVSAFAEIMRKGISMPAHCMHDGNNNNLFHHFCKVASRIGVYTATDYREILEHLVARWNVENLTGLSSEGRQAQEYVCGLAQRMKRVEEMAHSRAQEVTPIPFSWICNRLV